MTVKHWCEADYYAASRRARAAWEATQPQLSLGDEPFYSWPTRDELRAEGIDPDTGCPLDAMEVPCGLEGADAGTTSLVASAPSSPTDGLAAGETAAQENATRPIGGSAGSQAIIPGTSHRGRPSVVAPAASPPNPAADAARTSGTHSSGERGGGLDNPTTRET